MKILILANNDVGLYKFRKELLQDLISKKHKVLIALPDGMYLDELIHIGCQWYKTDIDRRGKNPFKDVMLFYSYCNMINLIRPDLIITYTIKPNIYGGVLARMKGIPYAVNVTGLGTVFQRDNFLKQMITVLYRQACKSAKVVFFENEENKAFFLERRIVRNHQSCVLSGAGVNVNEYSMLPYPESDKGLRFLFIGRVMQEKGVGEFMEVAMRIREKHKNLFFYMAGSMEESYQEQIKKLSDKGVIIYLGFQKDIKQIVKQCHCVVLPSYHEGMSNVLLECASMGRPIITSNIPGCREVIDEGKNGFLVKVGDANSLEQKVLQFAALNDEVRKEMGYRSRVLVEQRFSRINVIKQTFEQLF